MAIRVFEIAKEYSREPKEIIDILSKAGIGVSSQTAELDEHALHTLTAKIGKYKLKVIDGDQESEVTHDELPPSQRGKKKKKDEPQVNPAQRLQVRVIKKHDQAGEASVEESSEEDKEKARPRLMRKPNTRMSLIEQKIVGKRQEDDAQEAPPAGESAAPVQAAAVEEAPAARVESDENRDDKKATKRAESPVQFEVGSMARDRGNNRRDSRPPENRDNRPPQRDDRGGQNRDRPHHGRDSYDRDRVPQSRDSYDASAPRGVPARDQRDSGPPRDNRDRPPGPPREGGYQNRDNRPAGPPREGGYQNRDNRGPDNRGPGGPPREGGYQNRDNRGPDNRGPGGPPREGGGYQGQRDNRGPGGPPREGGGYQGQRDNRGPDNRGPGGPPREGGGYQGQRDNRGPGGPPREGGGYQGQRDNRGPGGPPREGGGYQGQRPSGPGGPPRSGGYQGGGGGGYQGGGGGGYQGGGGGGYQGQRGPGSGPGGPPRDNRGGPPRPGGAGGGRPDFRGKDDDDSRGPSRSSRPAPRSGGGGSSTMPPAVNLKSAGTRSRFGAQKPSSKKKGKRRGDDEQIEKIKVVNASRVELPQEDLGIIMLSEGATVKEIAEKVNRKAKDVIKRLFEKGILATLNDVLEAELALEIAKDFGYLAEVVSFEEDLQIREDESIEASSDEEAGLLEPRAPIVTIMGHVDHGKTTLLDAIRKAKVASGEAGGITQHIGAYSVPYGEKRIVFLDTPGHEAFTKMRARGASVTDIVVLVVAADDGVKPQTVEAINHAKAAKVPIITCINKIDKPEAAPEKVKQMLTEHELVVEEFGGDSPCVQVSAKKNIGLDSLLEMILLVADLNDYKASVNRRAKGTVIEAKLDRGRGPVATVVVQDGILRVGEYFITGQTYGKIRAMHDDRGRNVDFAMPSTPVEIIGVQEVPTAGDLFQVVEDEASARKISSFRRDKAREDNLRRHQHTSLDQLFSNLKQSEIKDLPIIIKADVQGSIEGLVFALNKIKSEKVNLRIVHQGVGSITENDVLLAVASDSIILGFNTKAERKAQDLADQEGIDVRHYSVIYEVVKEIEAAMLGLVAPTLEEREVGRATVRQLFVVAKGKVAGCIVDSGLIKRDCKVKVKRGENEVFSGTLQTLKRFRDDVNEVKMGYECGVGINGFSDLLEGDTLVFFIMEKVQATQL